jgi:metallo-beta-lactamase family protein
LAYIQFLGAAGTVTGSKHLVNTSPDANGEKGFQLLVDCGMFQGHKEWRERNWQPTPVPASSIDAVVLTHAHLDHCGWIPRLVREGFRGPIYATPATIDLCGIILPDSGHLQEEDARFYNRHQKSKHNPALPLYTLAEAQQSLQRFRPALLGEILQLSPEASFRFAPAGHILGSAMVELTLKLNGQEKKLLFSGDVGRVREHTDSSAKAVRSGPAEGEAADVLVMESTYGNRQHPADDPRPELAEVIRRTAARGGTVVVPAFAVERTQKFLFVIKELMEAGQIPRIPVYCDSPMAIKAVEVFLKYANEFTSETVRLIEKYGSPLQWPGFTFAISTEDSKKINASNFPAIIISSSGMVTGGRILHHLMQRLPDPRNTIIFVGFQAPGTRGATIKSGAREVRIFSETVPVRAQIAEFEQFSDHADTPELLGWLRTFAQKPAATYLVHGEPSASSLLKEAITKELGWDVQVAAWLQKAEIK